MTNQSDARILPHRPALLHHCCTDCDCRTFRAKDIPLPAAARFLTVEVVLNVLPRFQIWRALHGKAMSLWVDVPCGTAVGHAISFTAYFFLRWCGLPLLVWLVPLLVVSAFALVPRLRWVWRPTRDDAATTAYTLGVSAVLAFALVWFARFQVWNPVALPNEVYQSSDHPYLLSLAGELKHHFPRRSPSSAASLCTITGSSSVTRPTHPGLSQLKFVGAAMLGVRYWGLGGSPDREVGRRSPPTRGTRQTLSRAPPVRRSGRLPCALAPIHERRNSSSVRPGTS